jgi:hypothetical protein
MDELNLNDYCDEDEFTDLRKQKWYELNDQWKSVVKKYRFYNDYEKFFEEHGFLTFGDLFNVNEEDYIIAEKNWQGEVFVDGHLVHIIDFVEK